MYEQPRHYLVIQGPHMGRRVRKLMTHGKAYVDADDPNRCSLLWLGDNEVREIRPATMRREEAVSA